MIELDYVRDCLKDLRGSIDDALWQKVMSLFVHGEELMAMEILLEELTLNNVTVSSDQKEKLTKSAGILEISPDEFDVLVS